MAKKISTSEELKLWYGESSTRLVYRIENGCVYKATRNDIGKYSVSSFLYPTAAGDFYPVTELYVVQQKKRPMTHAEVFKALSGGAVVKYVGVDGDYEGAASNSWDSTYGIKSCQICYNYTGENDTWEAMEVEV